jgi:hypothetical protein
LRTRSTRPLRLPNIQTSRSNYRRRQTTRRNAYPFRDFTPHIKRLFDAYGPKRCYWGTDITNGYDKATYKQRITHFTEELSFLSEEDKDWVMGKSILERLSWA